MENTDLSNVLEHIKLTVESLRHRETNFLSVDAALKFMLRKVADTDTVLSQEFISALKRRIQECRTSFSGILQFLHSGKHSPKKIYLLSKQKTSKISMRLELDEGID